MEVPAKLLVLVSFSSARGAHSVQSQPQSSLSIHDWDPPFPPAGVAFATSQYEVQCGRKQVDGNVGRLRDNEARNR